MRATLLGLLTITTITACARRKPPKVTPVYEGPALCASTVWKTGEMRPANVEIINQSTDSVMVWMERCNGGTLVGDVGPRETAVLPLPSGAYSFMGLLRFNTYRGKEKRLGIELAAPEGDPHVKLVVPAGLTRDCPEVYVDGAACRQSLSALEKDRIAKVTYEPPNDIRGCPRIMVTLKK